MLIVGDSLMTQWIFSRGVEEQMRAFLDGFNEVVPLQWLQYFDERELEVMPVSCADSLWNSLYRHRIDLTLIQSVITSL